MPAIRKYPMENMLWYPGGSYKENALVNKICQITLHNLPAYLVDLFSVLSGRKPVMTRIVKKMHKAQKVTIQY